MTYVYIHLLWPGFLSRAAGWTLKITLPRSDPPEIQLPFSLQDLAPGRWMIPQNTWLSGRFAGNGFSCWDNRYGRYGPLSQPIPPSHGAMGGGCFLAQKSSQQDSPRFTRKNRWRWKPGKPGSLHLTWTILDPNHWLTQQWHSMCIYVWIVWIM